MIWGHHQVPWWKLADRNLGMRPVKIANATEVVRSLEKTGLTYGMVVPSLGPISQFYTSLTISSFRHRIAPDIELWRHVQTERWVNGRSRIWTTRIY